MCAQRNDGIISGRIISTEKEIVDFATVYLKGTHYGGTTNQEGIYHLNAPAGNYTLIISDIGYKTVEHYVILTAGQRIKQNITITPETQLLDEFGDKRHCFYSGGDFCLFHSGKRGHVTSDQKGD